MGLCSFFFQNLAPKSTSSKPLLLLFQHRVLQNPLQNRHQTKRRHDIAQYDKITHTFLYNIPKAITKI